MSAAQPAHVPARSYVTHLECSRCGATADASVLANVCPTDGGPYLVRYDPSDPSDIECNVGIGGGFFRKGPLSSLVNTYWVESHDGGATFSAPLRVSTATSNWCKAAYTGLILLRPNTLRSTNSRTRRVCGSGPARHLRRNSFVKTARVSQFS